MKNHFLRWKLLQFVIILENTCSRIRIEYTTHDIGLPIYKLNGNSWNFLKVSMWILTDKEMIKRSTEIYLWNMRSSASLICKDWWSSWLFCYNTLVWSLANWCYVIEEQIWSEPSLKSRRYYLLVEVYNEYCFSSAPRLLVPNPKEADVFLADIVCLFIELICARFGPMPSELDLLNLGA